MEKPYFWSQPWGWKQRLVYAWELFVHKHSWKRENPEDSAELTLAVRETPTAQLVAPFAMFVCVYCGEKRLLELVIGAPSGDVYQREWILK